MEVNHRSKTGVWGKDYGEPEGAASSEPQEWWIERDVDGCWHIGTGKRGFADLGEGAEAEATAKAIKDAHNAALAAEREKVLAQVGWHQDSDGLWNCPTLHLHGLEKPIVPKISDINLKAHDAEVIRPYKVAIKKATHELSNPPEPDKAFQTLTQLP